MAETGSTAELGALLRSLRGRLTQDTVSRHAKRHGCYLHRPTLSAIENGRRLPTSTELRGILLACGQESRFDELDAVRRRLQDPSARLPVRGQWLLPATAVLAVCGVIAALLVVVVGDHVHRPEPVDVADAVAAARESPLCAEALIPQPDLSFTVLAQERGPADSTDPNRLVEVRSQRDPIHGWIAWAHLATSMNPNDRLWLDWSYLSAPTEKQHWRMCGPHAITAGPNSPSVKGVDGKGRKRWVRACGQPPREDRPAGSRKTAFCTSWVPVEP